MPFKRPLKNSVEILTVFDGD